MGLLELPPEQVIDRAPVPTSWALGTVEGPQGTFIVLELYMPTGEVSVFMGIEPAEALASQIRDTAKGARASRLYRASPEDLRKILGNGDAK